MFRKSTNVIISACTNAVNLYDDDCREFLGTPGINGIKRKIQFVLLLSTLDNNSPEEAILKIYDFYTNEKLTCLNSRLVNKLEDTLMRLFDIGYKEFSCRSVYDHNRKAEIEEDRRLSVLTKCISAIKISADKMEEHKVRRASRLIYQGFRQRHKTPLSFFSIVPRELGIKIAGYMADSNILSTEKAEKIAATNFCKPK